jgi:hypothetical protein
MDEVLGLMPGTLRPNASAIFCARCADCTSALCKALGDGVKRLGLPSPLGPAKSTTWGGVLRVLGMVIQFKRLDSISALEKLADKASVIEAFFTFAQAEQQREAQALISAENLNPDAAKRYITHSLKREYASDNGTELNAMLPKMSPLNPLYLTKKADRVQKVAAFVEKFKGVGGGV